MRDSNYFYGYTVVTPNYMREIGKRDPKILIQLSRKNNWHLISDGMHKISHVFTPFTRFNEVTRFSYIPVQKLLVQNPFQRDSLCLYSTDHYKYWSPEQEPDSTEIFGSGFTRMATYTIPTIRILFQNAAIFGGIFIFL